MADGRGQQTKDKPHRFTSENQPDRTGKGSWLPRGRTKGSLNKKTVIMGLLNSPERVGNVMVPRMLNIINAMYKKAKKGDVQAANFLMDHGYGKLTQETDVKHTHTVQIHNPPPRGELPQEAEIVAIDGVEALPEGEELTDDERCSLNAVDKFVAQEDKKDDKKDNS